MHKINFTNDLDHSTIDPDTKICTIEVTFTYKTNREGEIIVRKAHFSYPRNLLAAGVHFYPDNVAVFTADMAAVLTKITIRLQCGMPSSTTTYRYIFCTSLIQGLSRFTYDQCRTLMSANASKEKSQEWLEI